MGCFKESFYYLYEVSKGFHRLSGLSLLRFSKGFEAHTCIMQGRCTLFGNSSASLQTLDGWYEFGWDLNTAMYNIAWHE